MTEARAVAMSSPDVDAIRAVLTVIDPVAQPFDPVSSGWSSEPGQ
jgi:hypothetical protein